MLMSPAEVVARKKDWDRWRLGLAGRPAWVQFDETPVSESERVETERWIESGGYQGKKPEWLERWSKTRGSSTLSESEKASRERSQHAASKRLPLLEIVCDPAWFGADCCTNWVEYGYCRPDDKFCSKRHPPEFKANPELSSLDNWVNFVHATAPPHRLPPAECTQE